MRRIMQTWYDRQNPQDLWRSTRGQSHHKAILRKLHYKPADPGMIKIMTCYYCAGSVDRIKRTELIGNHMTKNSTKQPKN